MKHLRFLLAVALAFTWVLPPTASATDLSITAANVIPGARAKPPLYGTAGVAITQGQLLYFDSTSGTYKLADANASATTAAVVGYAANAASTGQLVAVITEDDDMTVGATLSMTAPVYVLSANAGAIAPSADLTTGWYPAVVLIAKSTTKASFKIIKGPAACAMLHLDLPSALYAAVHRGYRSLSRFRREVTDVALSA